MRMILLGSRLAPSGADPYSGRATALVLADAAVESAPFYAAARLVRARSLDALGDASAARDAYREYIARASQSDAQGIATAVARVDALER